MTKYSFPLTKIFQNTLQCTFSSMNEWLLIKNTLVTHSVFDWQYSYNYARVPAGGRAIKLNAIKLLIILYSHILSREGHDINFSTSLDL